MKFRAKTNNQRHLDVNWDLINTYLSRWKPGTSLDIEIVRHKPKVSDPARRFYFSGVLPALMEVLGYEPHESELVHHQLKARYFENDKDLNVYQDERGVYRNVPSVFSNNPDVPPDKRKAFIDWTIRTAAKAGAYVEDAKEFLAR